MTSHVNRKHARFSPSGAKRVIKCPGSVAMAEGIPNTSSAFADEGTAAHEVCDHCLRNGLDADVFAGQYVNLDAEPALRISPEQHGERSFLIDPEMVDGVQLYLDTCRQIIAEASPEFEYEVEQWVALDDVPGMEGGTTDFGGYDPAPKKVTVVDFKYGQGVAVEPHENEQGLCYTLGLVKRFHNRGLAEVEIVIVQPRCPHAKGPVRRWTTDAVKLLEFEYDLIEAGRTEQEAAASFQPGVDGQIRPTPTPWEASRLKAGEWCKFCKAEAFCNVKRQRVLDIASAEFGPYDDQPTLPVVTQMSPDEIARVLRLRHEIVSWAARVDEFAHAEATHGRPPTGFKLVAKRATRKWQDEYAAAQSLILQGVEDVWTEPKLLSPAKIEPKMPGKNKAERAKALEALTVKESSGSVLAPEEDPRPALKAGVEEFAE